MAKHFPAQDQVPRIFAFVPKVRFGFVDGIYAFSCGSSPDILGLFPMPSRGGVVKTFENLGSIDEELAVSGLYGEITFVAFELSARINLVEGIVGDVVEGPA